MIMDIELIHDLLLKDHLFNPLGGRLQPSALFNHIALNFEDYTSVDMRQIVYLLGIGGQEETGGGCCWTGTVPGGGGGLRLGPSETGMP
jgi:hypothetical protein